MMGHIRTRADALVAAAKQAVVVGGTAVMVTACGGGGGEGHKPPVNPVDPETPTAPEVIHPDAVNAGRMNGNGKSIENFLQSVDPRLTHGNVTRTTANQAAKCDMPEGSSTLTIARMSDTPVETDDSCEVHVTATNEKGQTTVEGYVTVNSFLDTKPPQWKNNVSVKTIDGTYGGNITLADALPATDAGEITYNIDPSYFTRYPGNYYTLKDGKITWNAGAPAANIPVSVVDNVGNVNPTTGQINVTVVDTNPGGGEGGGNGSEPSYCDKYPNSPICTNN